MRGRGGFRGRRAVRLLLAVGAAMVGTGGCGRPVLTLEDGVAVNDWRQVELTAHVEHQLFGLLRTSVSNVPVRFFSGDNQLGEARTDEDGSATIRCDVGELGDSGFSASAAVFGASLNGRGRLFEMNDERVALIVDVDHTIARTDSRALLFSPLDGKSQPIPGSREVLWKLAEHFNIVYLTGRPRVMQAKTRAWLAENDYPPGPLVVAPAIRKAADNGKFKLQVLSHLRTKWPNLLIGVGDRPSDARAYGANEMLALVIAPHEIEEIGTHALLMPDWKAVNTFFEANHDALTDPTTVRELVAGRRPVLFTMTPYSAVADSD